MKKNSVFIGAMLLAASFWSCGGSSEESASLTHLHVQAADIRSLGDALESVEFIPLRVPEDKPLSFLMGNPVFGISDTHIAVAKVNFAGNSGIYIFDRQGELLLHFDKKGDGPGEYSGVESLAIEGDYVHVFPSLVKRLRYRLDDGSFVDELNLMDRSMYVPSMVDLGNERYLLGQDMELENQGDAGSYFTAFVIRDMKQDTLIPLPVKAPPIAYSLVESYAAKLRENLYVLNAGGLDTLYVLDGEDQVRPIVHLKLGDNPMPESAKSDYEGVDELIMQQKYSFNVGNIAAAGDMMQLMVFGLKKNPDMDLEDMSTAPIYNLFIRYPDMKYTVVDFVGDIERKSTAKDAFAELLSPALVEVLERKGGLKGKHLDAFQAAQEALTDEEDPILMLYKVRIP